MGNSAVALHDVVNGGATATAFDFTARYFVTAGTDGSMFVYETQGNIHIVQPRGHSAVTERAMSGIDMDSFDDMSEVPEVEAHKRRMAEEVLGGSEATDASRVTRQLATLRQQLLECIKMNEEAPDLEKLDRQDFIIDT